jgi:hypothetical protein
MKTLFSFAVAVLLCSAGSAQNIGIGTTTPAARLHVADSSVVFTGINDNILYPAIPPPIQGPGIRMLWYPQKAAFRAGFAGFNTWDRDNIGTHSFAGGQGTLAKGRSTTAFGLATDAIGDFSTATGIYTSTRAYGSMVIGAYNNIDDNPNPVSTAPEDRIYQIGNGSAENARSNALTVLRNGNVGIGTTNPAFKMDVGGRLRIRSGGDLNNSAGIFLNNTGNTAIPAFVGMQSDDQVGLYGNNSGWSFVMNTTNGNIGVGTTTPSTKLEVNGFTKMGTDAPAIKVKKLTGTTAATDGGDVNIPHGLVRSKILSVSVLVESDINTYIPPSSTYISGVEYNFDVYINTIWIYNIPGNSGNILSRTFKVLITYEE